MSQAVTQKEFAEIIGMHKSHVTRLKQAGRLVLDDNGRVLVEASRQRIKDTEDPNRDDVRDRHASSRVGGGEPPDGDAGDADLPRAIRILEQASAAWHAGKASKLPLLSFQEARQLKTNIEALAAGIDAMAAAGELVPAAEVRQVVMDRLTTVRTRLEALPAIMAPTLAAAKDEQQIKALLTEQIELALGDLAAWFRDAAG